MRIIIDYESSWRNSFLDGSNNEPLLVKGRNYVAASSKLNHIKSEIREKSYKKAGLSLNTVLGVLSRLIGEQRKLYQAKQCDNYYFKNLEGDISFTDVESKRTLSNEIVYLRNMTGSYDREAFTGPIDTNHWLFISDYSPQLWSLLFCERKELINYIINGIEPPEKLVPDPRNIVRRMAELKTIALTKIEEFELGLSDIKAAIDALNEPLLNEKLKCLFPTMKKVFQDIGYIENEKVNFRALYSSVLYLKLFRIHEGGGVIQGNIKGFSVAGFTAKDFMSCFTKGKKKVYGNPYVKKEKIKGIGEVKSMLTKASGQLEIKLDIDINKAIELKTMIDNAGVSAFYLGKKGLAYVSHIDVR